MKTRRKSFRAAVILLVLALLPLFVALSGVWTVEYLVYFTESSPSKKFSGSSPSSSSVTVKEVNTCNENTLNAYDQYENYGAGLCILRDVVMVHQFRISNPLSSFFFSSNGASLQSRVRFIKVPKESTDIMPASRALDKALLIQNTENIEHFFHNIIDILSPLLLDRKGDESQGTYSEVYYNDPQNRRPSKGFLTLWNVLEMSNIIPFSLFSQHVMNRFQILGPLAVERLDVFIGEPFILPWVFEDPLPAKTLALGPILREKIVEKVPLKDEDNYIVIVERKSSRKFTNIEEMKTSLQIKCKEYDYCFNDWPVIFADFDKGYDAETFDLLLSKATIILGTHGAGLTNSLLMRKESNANSRFGERRSVCVQILSWRLEEWPFHSLFESLCKSVGFNYMEWEISDPRNSYFRKPIRSVTPPLEKILSCSKKRDGDACDPLPFKIPSGSNYDLVNTDVHFPINEFHIVLSKAIEMTLALS